MARLLIADGNDREGRARHARVTGRSSAESYAEVVVQIAPDAACTLINPADADAALPAGAGLGAFDGLVFSGSTLSVAEETPAVRRQLDLMRAALEAGLFVFGSCWGVQVAAVVAGGDVGRSPGGPEYGFARCIAPTAPGGDHPLLAGRAPAWDAPTIHSDAVLTPPPGSVVLAQNRPLAVQAIEIRHGRGLFWGTQYHPELDLDLLAAMLRLSAASVVEAGFAPDAAAVEAHAREIAALHRAGDGAGDPALRGIAWRCGIGPDVLDPARRRSEIGNFLRRLARPRSRAGATG